MATEPSFPPSPTPFGASAFVAEFPVDGVSLPNLEPRGKENKGKRPVPSLSAPTMPPSPMPLPAGRTDPITARHTPATPSAPRTTCPRTLPPCCLRPRPNFPSAPLPEAERCAFATLRLTCPAPCSSFLGSMCILFSSHLPALSVSVWTDEAVCLLPPAAAADNPPKYATVLPAAAAEQPLALVLFCVAFALSVGCSCSCICCMKSSNFWTCASD